MVRGRVPAIAAAAIALVGLVATAVAAAVTVVVPIEDTGPPPTLPAFIGKPATAHPVAGVRPAWQDSFMAPDPLNSVHGDAWATDNYTALSGPLGHDLKTLSTGIGRDCITLTFLQLPFVPPPAGTNPALNTTGGAYFYLDNHNRVVVAASTDHILVIALKTVNGTP